MIHEIKGRRLFTPVRLINYIVRWIFGIYSPTGTIRVHNSAAPDKGKSMSIDVDMEAVFADVEKRLDGRGLSAAQRVRIRDVMRAHIDGTTLIWGDAGATVNQEWLRSLIEGLIPVPDTTDAAQQPTSALDMVSGDSGGSSLATDTFTAGAAGGIGCTIYILCRTPELSSTQVGLYLRPFTITSDGRIYSIGAEDGTGTDVVHYSPNLFNT